MFCSTEDIMDWSQKLSFTAFLIVTAAIHGAYGDAMVTGTVFCDQCKDGQISLYDYPLYGNIDIFLLHFFMSQLRIFY